MCPDECWHIEWRGVRPASIYLCVLYFPDLPVRSRALAMSKVSPLALPTSRAQRPRSLYELRPIAGRQASPPLFLTQKPSSFPPRLSSAVSQGDRRGGREGSRCHLFSDRAFDRVIGHRRFSQHANLASGPRAASAISAFMEPVTEATVPRICWLACRVRALRYGRRCCLSRRCKVLVDVSFSSLIIVLCGFLHMPANPPAPHSSFRLLILYPHICRRTRIKSRTPFLVVVFPCLSLKQLFVTAQDADKAKVIVHINNMLFAPLCKSGYHPNKERVFMFPATADATQLTE